MKIDNCEVEDNLNDSIVSNYIDVIEKNTNLNIFMEETDFNIQSNDYYLSEYSKRLAVLY